MNLLAFQIALRSLFSKRSRYAHSAIGWVALIGLILGVTAQVVALSILGGFERHFTDSILSFNADLVLLRDGEISNPDLVRGQLLDYEKQGVKSSTPFLYREGLIAHHSKIKGFVIKGVESSSFTNVYNLNIKLYSKQSNLGNTSEIHVLDAATEAGVTPVLLGSDLAEYLGVTEQDPIVSILLPKGDIQKISDPKQFRKFKVVGTFSSGLYEFDSQFALMGLGSAQAFFEVPGVVTGYEMKVAELEKASQIAEAMAKDFSFPYQALSWDELNAEIFQALKLEKKLFFIIMGLIVIVAAANLIGLVVILISEQSKEISILKVMGMKNKILQRIFTFQGLFLAFIGIGAGCGLGYLAADFLAKHSFIRLAKEVYLVSELPVALSGQTLLWVFAFGSLSAYLATRLAARRVLGLHLDL